MKSEQGGIRLGNLEVDFKFASFAKASKGKGDVSHFFNKFDIIKLVLMFIHDLF